MTGEERYCCADGVIRGRAEYLRDFEPNAVVVLKDKAGGGLRVTPQTLDYAKHTASGGGYDDPGSPDATVIAIYCNDLIPDCLKRFPKAVIRKGLMTPRQNRIIEAAGF